MKKIIMTTWAFIAIVCLVLVSCEKDTSKKHTYTPEELEWIRINDSLKQIIPADFVLSQNVTVPISKGYEGVTVKLVADADTARFLDSLGYDNMSEIVAALGTLDAGVQSGNDITFFAYNYSTKYEYTSPSTTNYFGHWFDANGDVVNWGDQAYLFCEKQDETTTNFTIGLFPDRPTVGNVYKIVEAIEYDGYKIAFLFNVTIGPKEGLPVTTLEGTQTINFDAEAASGWVDIEVQFDTTTIASEIGCSPRDAKIYGLNPDGSLYDGNYTANNGFWYNRSEEISSWGSEALAYYAEYRADDNYIGVGQMPDSCIVGETYTAKLAFVNLTTLKQYNVVLNMTITEPELVYPVTTVETTLNIALNVPAEATNWVDNPMALDSTAVYTAIGCAPSAATYYGIDATRSDSLYIKGFTSNAGYFFNTSGDVCAYAATNCAFYIEFTPEKTINIGQYPGGCVSGTTYNAKVAFVNGDKQANVAIALTIQ